MKPLILLLLPSNTLRELGFDSCEHPRKWYKAISATMKKISCADCGAEFDTFDNKFVGGTVDYKRRPNEN